MESKRHTGGIDSAIAALANRQHGVIHRRQLRKLGLSDREISSRIERGNLQPLFRGTYAVGHRALRQPARLLAAVLASGEGAVISHGSAAELLGLWDKSLPVVDVISPIEGGRKIDGIRRHNVLRPLAAEIEVVAGVPCTNPSRTLIDIAARLGDRSHQRMVEQAAVLRLLDVAEIDRILARGRRHGGPRVRRSLAAWRTATDRKPLLRSLLEARLLPALSSAGVPRPECNIKLDVGARPLEVDLLWREQRLVIEVDGRKSHETRVAFERDRWRDQLLVAAGFRVVRVTWKQLEREPSAVVNRIHHMLRAP